MPSGGGSGPATRAPPVSAEEAELGANALGADSSYPWEPARLSPRHARSRGIVIPNPLARSVEHCWEFPTADSKQFPQGAPCSWRRFGPVCYQEELVIASNVHVRRVANTKGRTREDPIASMPWIFLATYGFEDRGPAIHGGPPESIDNRSLPTQVCSHSQ